MAFVYRRRTTDDICRRILDFAIQDDAYERVLDALESGIRASAKRIEKANDEDAIVDVETEIIEGLLGTAFVVCQVQITAVTRGALLFPAVFPDAASVRRIGPSFSAKYSKVEVLWGLANYYKHRDEWNQSTWTAPKGSAKRTVQVIKVAGLRSGSTGNLRAGSRTLGNAEFTDVAVFQTIVGDWSKQLRAKVP